MIDICTLSEPVGYVMQRRPLPPPDPATWRQSPFCAADCEFCARARAARAGGEI